MSKLCHHFIHLADKKEKGEKLTLPMKLGLSQLVSLHVFHRNLMKLNEIGEDSLHTCLNGFKKKKKDSHQGF